MYFESLPNWYFGALGSGIPGTNNATENFNKLMKQSQTHYERKPFAVYLNDALRYVADRSKYYIDNPPPATEPHVSKEIRMKGYNIKKSYVSNKIDEQYTEYFMFTGENPDKITQKDVDDFNLQTIKSFNAFKINAFRIHKIKLNVKEWKDSVCTCPAYGGNYVCKHIVYLAHELNLLPPPLDLLEETTAVAPAKNPRGRPRKATKALLKD